MFQKLRSLHLSTALFSMVFLLAYAVSAVEFAHRKWLPLSEYSIEESRKLAAGSSARTAGEPLCRIARLQLGGFVTHFRSNQFASPVNATPRGVGNSATSGCFRGDPYSDQTANSLPLGSAKWNLRPPGNENVSLTRVPPAALIFS
jgi:hypothetical protein